MSYSDNAKEGLSLAKKLFNKILNKEVTRVLISYKGCATLDFGKDIKIENSKKNGFFTRGEWSFWLYSCAWRLDKDGHGIVGSWDSSEKIQKELPKLEKAKLLKVDIVNDSFDLILDFDNKQTLHAFSCATEEPEPWNLSTPNRKVFAAQGSGAWEYEHGSTQK